MSCGVDHAAVLSARLGDKLPPENLITLDTNGEDAAPGGCAKPNPTEWVAG